MKKISIIFLVVALLLSTFITSYAENDENKVTADRYVESVDVCLPDIDVYVSGVSGTDFSAKASFDGESLKYDGAEVYNPSSTSTCIYILADISGSVSTYTYNAVKETVKGFIKGLTSKQIVKYYTFSQDVTQVLEGGESYEEACAKLDSTTVTGNGYTALYDALYLIHEKAVEEKDKFDRQLAIVFTDGVDEDNKAKRTFDETKNILKTLDLPVYAMCMDYATTESKNKLGEISRVSGGTNYIYNTANIQQEFNELTKKAFSCVCLHFSKDNNKAGDKDKNLSVSINDVALPVVTVYESSVRIKDDTTAPTYSVSYSEEENCMIVEYSENVVNADNAAAYVITNSDGNAVPVESVKYDKASKTAYLYFSDRFYSDNYTVELSGVTDDSHAANKPDAPVVVDIKAASPALKILDHWWLILVPFFVVVIILLVLIVVKRKRKVTNVKELFEVENEQNYEVRHHIVNAVKGREMMLNIVTDNVRNEIKTRITSSLIFGRSDTCDICIDDVKLSRQHFAIETQGNGDITICDLNSTNGTYLNGNRLTTTMILKPGDTIAAGLTKIKVNF